MNQENQNLDMNNQQAQNSQPMPEVNNQTPNPQPSPAQDNTQNQNASGAFNDVNDVSSTFTQQEKEDGKVMAILSYIGILVLIPYFTEKNNQYVRYHAKQGLNLFIIEMIATCALSFLRGFAVGLGLDVLAVIISIPLALVSLCETLFMVLGIINAAQGQAKELPIIGKIKIIK